jgi:Cu+-exporting ATPase
MNKVVFKIIDMHCTSCSITIDGDLEDAEGITSARTSYAKAVTEVEFDPKIINETEIREIIKATGYTVEPLH